MVWHQDGNGGPQTGGSVMGNMVPLLNILKYISESLILGASSFCSYCCNLIQAVMPLCFRFICKVEVMIVSIAQSYYLGVNYQVQVKSLKCCAPY